MTRKFKDQDFLTDNDLSVSVLGFWPGRKIKNLELLNSFQEKYSRDFLGGDEFVAYAQSLVSNGMDFDALEEEMLKDIRDPEKGDIGEIIFKKTASGIGRGHSLGGLSGVAFGIHGTKMIDSGLTGLCMSRSLVTSSRRRETTTEEIAIPEVLFDREDLLKEYLEISRDVLRMSSDFKDKFGKLGGVETFNKVIPYNNPADLFIVLPLDTLSTIVSETRADNLNPNGRFIPREVHTLAEKLAEIEESVGQGTMFRQRIEVPRDTYLHYCVFKDPSSPNYSLEKGIKNKMSIDPIVIECFKDFTSGFYENLKIVIGAFKRAGKTNDPEELHKRALESMYALRNFSNEYNEAVRIKIADTLSWRVWSEQKRHSTLRQNVESVYSAVYRAEARTRGFWELIEKAYKENNFEIIEGKLDELEKYIVIDERMKKSPELIIPYIYHTARQLKFYDKLLEEGIEERDALYIAPKNIRVRTLENYDLANLVDLELPLRLCDTCEPERKASSWKKREKILEIVPELERLIQPKCNIGYCTEGKYCGNVLRFRDDYNQELHKEVKTAMLGR
ncbi:MAG: FAD-dependent thymidylate synthase [Nanoarchaeota archaeon]